MKHRFNLFLSFMVIILNFSFCSEKIFFTTKTNQTISVEGNKLKDGLWMEKFDNGLVTIGKYKNGEKNGWFKESLQDATVNVGRYEKNVRVGTWKSYNNGELLTVFKYENGKVINTRQYSPIH